ncbi:flagellar type III secretion system protein FlhB [Pseudooceanicola sp. CBS1P-1]|uniref:Flagellar type III secretion system protein FlhB n=1 Tax=Pseudooceanicola albus TaxID=2692189 RepID=A0A6L7G755_9RHOB|nr:MULTISPECIES: flagellar type III secretion system protein FlhB [Pseudooceanicola]MBT9385863.1 flagellar type III secretion system protein FlhB [Pseudooceanicola endophyticus]MXN20094.1 flagellar type III secretion system protein FlhB [Pseudooceanicola albus]
MADTEDSGEKPHEPTDRKLQKARQKGEVPRSSDLSTAAAYGGLCVAGLALGGPALVGLGSQMQGMVDQSAQLGPLMLSGGTSLAGGMMAEVALRIAPLFLVPAAAVLAIVFAQQAFVVSAERIRPKLSRLSPVANAKQKFGRGGLSEFLKSLAKLLIYSFVLYRFIDANFQDMVMTLELDPGQGAALLGRLCLSFLFLVFTIALAIGGIDFLWQRSEHLRKNRMTDKEIRDEMKEAEGDPHMKQQRRMRGEQIARSQMMAEVPKADVVIVNPTHYAVALKWDRRRGSAPVCVAKGMDEVAHVIRRIAAEHGVPIHSDPPTARRLHTEVEIGAEIAPSDYRAVAAAIRFADQMRRKAKARI